MTAQIPECAPHKAHPGLRDDSGSAVIEYAATTLAVFTLIFLGIQVALYSYARSVALTAAQEAATVQRAYDAPASAARHRAAQVIAAQGDVLTGTSITVATAGNLVTVTVTGSSISLLPGIGWRVTQTASAPIEGFHS